MGDLKEKIAKARNVIKTADAVFITAGSGMSYDSGVPDFNETYLSRLTKSVNNLSNPIWFDKNPRIAWAFYGHRLNLYRQTLPHEGFNKLLEMSEKKQYGYFIFTSNVDGQFQKSGFDDAFIEECHGSIHHFQCVRPCSSDIWDATDENINVDLEIFEATGELPKCPNCGGIARPNILMFSDWSWISHRSNDQGNRLQQWIETIESLGAKIAIIEIGAGHVVPTVRLQSQRISRSVNSILIRINPKDYDVHKGAIGLPLGAKEGVEIILGN